jgi:hypothetical protein
MKHRLAQLKRCRADQISKYNRLKAHSLRDPNVSHDKHKDTSSSFPILGLQNRIQQQDSEIVPAGVPSHSTLPHLDAWYSQHRILLNQGQETLFEDNCERRSSDKEVIFSQSDTLPDNSIFSLNLEPGLVMPSINNRVVVGKLEPAFIFEEDKSSSSSTGARRTHSKLSSIRSSSIHSLRVRLSSRLSRSSSHVNSLLSMTNSWKSSLVYAGSVSSDRMSTTSNLPLTHHEALAFNELVDETKLDKTTSRQHPDFQAASLLNRPCCEFFENDTHKRTLCNVCGFSEMHHIARISLSDDGDWIDSSLLDRFGNTPLHHAAAAGNTARVLQIMGSGAQFLARNTCGETFLHVFHIDSFEQFAEFVEVLRKAANMGFPFNTRDYNGSAVLSRINALTYSWCRDTQVKADVAQILKSAATTGNALEGDRTLAHIKDVDKKMKEQKRPIFGLNQLKDVIFHPKLRRLKPAESNSNMDTGGDTKLISTLKKWSEKPLPRAQLEYLIQRSDIHMRDLRGYTALAIAARHGVRDAVSLLLKYGANPNTRSHEKTSVLAHAATHLARAEKENNGQLYARILSCIVLLTDHGAKAVVSVFDEYTWRPSPSTLDTLYFRMALSAQEMHTPLSLYKDNISELDTTSFRILEAADTRVNMPELSSETKILPPELDALDSTMELYSPISPISETLRQFSGSLTTVDEEDDAELNSIFGDRNDTWLSDALFSDTSTYSTRGGSCVCDMCTYNTRICSFCYPGRCLCPTPHDQHNFLDNEWFERAWQPQSSVETSSDFVECRIYDEPCLLNDEPCPMDEDRVGASSLKGNASDLKRRKGIRRKRLKETGNICEICHTSFSRLDNLRAHTRFRHSTSCQTNPSTLCPPQTGPQIPEVRPPPGVSAPRQKRRLSDEVSLSRPSRNKKYIKIPAKEKKESGSLYCSTKRSLSQGNEPSLDWHLDPGGLPIPPRMPQGHENSSRAVPEKAVQVGGSTICPQDDLAEIWRDDIDGFVGHLANESLSNGFKNWEPGELLDSFPATSFEVANGGGSKIISGVQNIGQRASQHSEFVSSEGIPRHGPDKSTSTMQNLRDLHSRYLDGNRPIEPLNVGMGDDSERVFFNGEQLQEPLETAVSSKSVCELPMVYQ